MDFNSVVGNRIKTLRLERRMTREELSEAADISVSFIYEIETGKKSFSVYTLKRLTEALGVSTDYILGDEEENVDNMLRVEQLLTEAINRVGNIRKDLKKDS